MTSISKAVCSVLLSALLAGPACADNWPSKPIKLVVPYPPGGSSPAEFKQFIGTEIEKWKKLIQISGARAAD